VGQIGNLRAECGDPLGAAHAAKLRFGCAASPVSCMDVTGLVDRPRIGNAHEMRVRACW
jgi:hypothetical protein